MEEIFSDIDTQTNDNTIIDTTGSVIYTSVKTRSRLSKRATIVYLKPSDSHIDEMFQSYIADPKPVIWGNSFSIHSGESKQDALKRCYPELLSYRQIQYEKVADIVISYRNHHKESLSIYELLQHQ